MVHVCAIILYNGTGTIPSKFRVQVNATPNSDMTLIYTNLLYCSSLYIIWCFLTCYYRYHICKIINHILFGSDTWYILLVYVFLLLRIHRTLFDVTYHSFTMSTGVISYFLKNPENLFARITIYYGIILT